MNYRHPRLVPPQTTCRLPRVRMSMLPINKEIQIYPIGTTIPNKSNEFNHIGKIIDYDGENKLYTIVYKDSDCEEIS